MLSRFCNGLCKLVFFLGDLSAAVSVQSLIAVDRFGAVVYPLRSPLISSKLCPFFILTTWIVAIAVSSPELFVNKLVEYPEGLFCENHWNEVFGESSSRESYHVSYLVVFTFIPLVFIAILYIIIYLKLKSQKIPGEQSANAGQQRQQMERNVLKMAMVCSMLPAPRHTVYSLLYEQHHIAELWRPILFLCCPLTVCCKFCHKPFYLLHFQQQLS